MATFAEQMVEKYRTLLADSAGLKTVTVDGQSVTYGELEERLRYWESRVAAARREAGTAARVVFVSQRDTHQKKTPRIFILTQDSLAANNSRGAAQLSTRSTEIRPQPALD